MLGVCGASLVSPGWLVLGVKVDVCDVETMKIRNYNVIPDLYGRTYTHVTFDLTKHRDLIVRQ